MFVLITRKLLRVIPRFVNLLYIWYNRLLFMMNCVHYGKNIKVYNKIYVRGHGKIIIGDNFLCFSGGCVNPISRNVRGSLYAEKKTSVIEIGNNVGMSSTCLWARERISVGNHVNVGGNTLIIDNDAHPHDFLQRRRTDDKTEIDILTSPVIIEDDVWIGAQCIILKGVHIGARSIIAAGSVVTGDIPADCVAGGNPCKVITSKHELPQNNHSNSII